jgi:phosphoserine phosphatase RsbU/P
VIEGLRILLVEDDDVDRMRVHRAVKKAGSPVVLIDARDIESARAALANEKIDCAVIDFNLPDGTALDLLAFNAGGPHPSVPMVVLTGEADDQRALEALHSGAQDYLEKDRFEVDTFFRAIRYAVERARLSRDLEATNARLARELQIGGNIQTSILPRQTAVEGLEIVARMVPATEVGGDYYDVLPAPDGCWIAIGDVAGHGMGAAVVALMAQSAVAALSRFQPAASPSDIVCALNEVLYDNIRQRLAQDEHVTFTLLRYHAGGKVVFAGAHEEILVCRGGKVDSLVTLGTWLGARRAIADATSDSETSLAVGDTMVLYTDGITEARDASGEQYGLERMVALIERHHDAPVNEILTRIWDDVVGFMAEQDDDLTLLVIRRTS